MKQALILGATNPVGCRLAEALCGGRLTAVALMDDWAQAARLARLPVRMIDGHIADQEALARAMAGCDVVFHCVEYGRAMEPLTRGSSGSLRSIWHRVARRGDSASVSRRNLAGTEAVLSVALQSGIRRVIWLNPAAVPAAPEEPTLRSYHERGLSVTVLRPPTLYGPFCPWTIDVVRALRRGRRPRGGSGPCLYVDHLVEAMLLAADTETSGGEVFPLSDDEPTSCEELLEAHARAVSGHLEPALAASSAGGREPRAGADFHRARQLPGYNPTSGFVQNMERTAAWIQWARL